MVRSKTAVEAQGAVVAVTPAGRRALDAIRPVGADGRQRVIGLSDSQIIRPMAQNGAPTHEIERQGRWKQGGGMVGRYTRGESAGSALRYL